jgi:hypothetical protein
VPTVDSPGPLPIPWSTSVYPHIPGPSICLLGPANLILIAVPPNLWKWIRRTTLCFCQFISDLAMHAVLTALLFNIASNIALLPIDGACVKFSFLLCYVSLNEHRYHNRWQWILITRSSSSSAHYCSHCWGRGLPCGFRIRRTVHNPPRGPSAGWWVLTSGLTCLPKLRGTRNSKFVVTHPMID